MQAATAARTLAPDDDGGRSRAEPPEEPGVWVGVCALEDIVPDTGVAALLGGRQVAVVRVGRGSDVYAIGNFDPFSRAQVLARGIVGDRGGVPKIASPIYKQSFDLRTGVCLDDPGVRVPTYEARVRAGFVEILLPPEDDGRPVEAR